MRLGYASWIVTLAAAAIACSQGAAEKRRDQPAQGAGDGGGLAVGDVGSLRHTCDTSQPGAPILRRLTRQELENSIGDVFPEIAGDWGGVQLGPDPNSNLGFANDATVLLVGDSVAEKILATAEDVARLVTDDTRLPQLLPCSQIAKDAACAATFIGQYGPRLFRRPLTADEQASYAAYHASVAGRSTFALGIKWTLVAMMQSPHAVYRSELGDAKASYAAGQTYPLTQYQIASELAYTFGGSTPSADLLAKAGRGELSTADQLVIEARKLQQTDRGQEVIREFFREWLDYKTVVDKVKTTTKDFDLVKGPMAEETRRFLDQVVLTKNGGVRDLLTAPYTVVNSSLATFYGIGSGGAILDYQMVDRPANMSVGILAQASILAGNAQADRSSPTKRGLLIFEKLFCNVRPKPPAMVPPLEMRAPPDPTKTTRERFEKQHANQAPCNGCHVQFDPIGFSAEHFDEVGRYRDNENGNAIDATGKNIPIDPSAGDASTKISFDGLTDLANKLSALPEVSDCVSGYISTYSFGGVFDCPAEEQRRALAAGTIGLREYMAQLAGTAHFVRRSQ
jgi:hypothetical protein